jgi:hypothetical protein
MIPLWSGLIFQEGYRISSTISTVLRSSIQLNTEIESDSTVPFLDVPGTGMPAGMGISPYDVFNQSDQSTQSGNFFQVEIVKHENLWCF